MSDTAVLNTAVLEFNSFARKRAKQDHMIMYYVHVFRIYLYFLIECSCH